MFLCYFNFYINAFVFIRISSNLAILPPEPRNIFWGIWPVIEYWT